MPYSLSRTMRPVAYKDSTAWMATCGAGALNVSNMICVLFSLIVETQF